MLSGLSCSFDDLVNVGNLISAIIVALFVIYWASQVAQMVKNLLAMQET